MSTAHHTIHHAPRRLWYGMVWYGMVWYDMVDVCDGSWRPNMLRPPAILHRLLPYHVKVCTTVDATAWYGTLRYGMVDVCDGYLAAEASRSSFG